MTLKSNLLNNIYPELTYVIDRVCTPSWRLEGHIFSYNLMLIYDGEAFFTKNNETFKGTKGDLIFYSPGDFRTANTYSPKLMKLFAVEFLYTCPTYANNGWKLNNCDLPFSSIEKIQNTYLYSRLLYLFSKLCKMWLIRKNNLTQERLIFNEILSLLIQYKECNNYTYSDIRKVEQIINYITEHYADKVTLEDICEKMQLSPSYLGNIFKRVTGKSTIEYLIHLRINKAKDFLRNGYSISDTAKMVGFNDIYYFSKAFKKYESVTPSQFRKDFVDMIF